MTATARRLVDIGEVSRMLAARIGTLAPELCPDGRREGQEWCALNPDTGKYGQFNIHIGGGKAGVWKNFVAGVGGDALDLVAYVLFAGDKGRALKWSLQWLGIEPGDPRTIETVRRATPPQAETDAKTEAEAQEARNGARRIWLAAQPELRDTPVDLYLRGRGIALAEMGRQPRAIRFHPRLWNVESKTYWPAMVTAITGDAPGGFMSVHRTWLCVAPDGSVKKAPLDKPKLTLGLWRGGHISLWRGASGKPLKDMPDGETVDITEGIEDGLSVAYAAPECRVLAAVSLSNMGTIVLPPAATVVRLWRQNDTAREAIRAFDKGVRAHMAAGRRVIAPPMPRGVKDVNDLLRCDDA